MDATIDKFLQYIRLELNLSPHTVTAYGTDLDQWEQYLTQGKRQLDVASVTPSDIRAWMLWLNNNGDGARTMRRKVQAVRSFYKWLMRQGVVTSSPAAAVEMARIPKRLPSMVRETSVDSLLDSDIDMDDFEQVRNRLIVMMLYETGMRRAELIGLRDANVDTGKMELKVHGKRDKDRIIPFGIELAQWIDSYRRLRDQQAVGCDALSHARLPCGKGVALAGWSEQQAQSARAAAHLCHGNAQQRRVAQQRERAPGPRVARDNTNLHSCDF